MDHPPGQNGGISPGISGYDQLAKIFARIDSQVLKSQYSKPLINKIAFK